MGDVIEVEVGSDWRRGQVGRTVVGPNGVVEVPADWAHVPPGDPLVTRRIKAKGPAWVVVEKVRNKRFSRGLFAPRVLIERVLAAAELERGTEGYRKKLDAGRVRREREQSDYVRQFHREVVAFLAFAPVHAAVADRLAERVTAHATPVGSGTVARTKRIEVDRRAEAAVIAWMRHQTTAYDSMTIARVAGRRREVRRELASRSRSLLERYRAGLSVAPGCPLAAALAVAPKPEPVVAVVKTAVVDAAPVTPKAAPVMPKDAPVVDAAPVTPKAATVMPKPAPPLVKPAPVTPKPAPPLVSKDDVTPDDDPRRARMDAVRARMAQRAEVAKRPSRR